MRIRFIYVTLLTCSLVLGLVMTADHLPSGVTYALLPGSYIAVMINGNLHNRVIPGFLAVATLFNCIFYSALALLATSKMWKSR